MLPFPAASQKPNRDPIYRTNSPKSMCRSEICPRYHKPQPQLSEAFIAAGHPLLGNGVDAMSMRCAPVVYVLTRSWGHLGHARCRCALRFGAAVTADCASDTAPAGENGLNGNVVKQPVVVCPAVRLPASPVFETAGHLVVVPGMRPYVPAVDPVLIRIRAVVGA